jgi:hypothetical protein
MSSFFQKPQVQAILWRLCAASGGIGMVLAKFCAYVGLPVPDPSTTTLIVTSALTWLAETILAWYRNNPNNMLRKFVLRLNGADVTPETKALVAEAASNIPGAQLQVDMTAGSLASPQLKALAFSDTTAPNVVPKPTPGGKP